MTTYKQYKQTYHLTLYGRNDYNRLANGNSTTSSVRKEQVAVIPTPYLTSIYSMNNNSKIYRFNLGNNFKNIARGSKAILTYARMPGITNSYIHRTIRLCGAEGTNCFDSERGITTNPVLAVYGEGGTTDYNYFNTDPVFNGLEVPSNFLSKGYIEVEISTVASIGDISFVQTELDDMCLSFIIVEPTEEQTQDVNLAPKVNLASLGYKVNVPNFQ